MKSERKAQLASRILDHLLDSPNPDPSFRALAAAVGVTRPTLVHHFGDRQGALRAALAYAGGLARPPVDRVGVLVGGPDEILRSALGWLVTAWTEERLGRVHQVGLVSGLSQPELGSIYVQEVLEPTLSVFEGLLAQLHTRGALRVTDPRAAALQLLSPVLLGLLHQEQLGGRQHRPLDLARFVERHVDTVLQAYRPGDARR